MIRGCECLGTIKSKTFDLVIFIIINFFFFLSFFLLLFLILFKPQNVYFDSILNLGFLGSMAVGIILLLVFQRRINRFERIFKNIKSRKRIER